jgi:hypothetical protein
LVNVAGAGGLVVVDAPSVIAGHAPVQLHTMASAISWSMNEQQQIPSSK